MLVMEQYHLVSLDTWWNVATSLWGGCMRWQL